MTNQERVVNGVNIVLSKYHKLELNERNKNSMALDLETAIRNNWREAIDLGVVSVRVKDSEYGEGKIDIELEVKDDYSKKILEEYLTLFSFITIK